jgi:hypothetical protein
METDEEYATVVLRRLDGPLPGTSTVDIGRAVAEGRRRRRIRRLTGLLSAGTATAVVLVAVPVAVGALRPASPSPGVVMLDGSGLPTGTAAVVAQPPPAPTACTIAKLPVPQGEMSLVTGGDPTGRYLVGRSYPDDTGGRPLLMWHDGVVRQIDVPGDDQAFSDVTSTGDAVGATFIDGRSTGLAYLNGKLYQLAGADSEARAINAQGVIVGTADKRAVLWRSATSTPTPLATPAGDWQGEAYGIDDDGTIVGTVQSGGVEAAVVWYPDGSVHELAKSNSGPSNSGPMDGARAFRLYAGWATGMAGRVAVRWNVHTGTAQPIPELSPPVEGVNRYGWVVGTDQKGHAVLVSDAGALTLPSLVSQVQGTDNIAYVISDDGRTIAGQSVLGDQDHTVRAVVWHCH